MSHSCLSFLTSWDLFLSCHFLTAVIPVHLSLHHEICFFPSTSLLQSFLFVFPYTMRFVSFLPLPYCSHSCSSFLISWDFFLSFHFLTAVIPVYLSLYHEICFFPSTSLLQSFLFIFPYTTRFVSFLPLPYCSHSCSSFLISWDFFLFFHFLTAVIPVYLSLYHEICFFSSTFLLQSFLFIFPYVMKFFFPSTFLLQSFLFIFPYVMRFVSFLPLHFCKHLALVGIIPLLLVSMHVSITFSPFLSSCTVSPFGIHNLSSCQHVSLAGILTANWGVLTINVGPKKVEISGHTPSNGPKNGFPPFQIHTSRPI